MGEFSIDKNTCQVLFTFSLGRFLNVITTTAYNNQRIQVREEEKIF